MVIECAICNAYLDNTDRADLYICPECGMRHVIPEAREYSRGILKADVDHVFPHVNPEHRTLLQRIYIQLDDQKWMEAIERCDRILDEDPTCGEAYLARAMAFYDVRRRRWAMSEEKRREMYCNVDYTRARKYGIDLEKEAKDYHTFCEKPRKEAKQKADADRAKRAESVRKSRIYGQATETLAQARATTDLAQKRDLYREAQKLLQTIDGHKDTAALLTECNQVLNALSPEAIKAYQKSKDLEAMYDRAVANMERGDVRSLEKAIERFEKLGNYRDSALRLAQCRQQLDILLAPIRAEQEALERQHVSEAKARRIDEEWHAQCRRDGRCQHCGGHFEGFWSPTCRDCGRRKDY